VREPLTSAVVAAVRETALTVPDADSVSDIPDDIVLDPVDSVDEAVLGEEIDAEALDTEAVPCEKVNEEEREEDTETVMLNPNIGRKNRHNNAVRKAIGHLKSSIQKLNLFWS
jgi:hypothetical protein